ncbi:DUF2591 family protein [Cedecea neteri]|uniref:phage protein NinX family protein n=1 Tax=Cedecea neteri TaxID=158822 RepID=UPI00289339F6|nr:phage protein NinX family protein [Cedecea neteri]WNJ77770.1 DUF2591 family protein [Cedecea neteri]
MTDYSQMSDFEINKRVFKAITGEKPLGYPHNADGRSVGNVKDGEYLWYDYCNIVSDGWPIVIKNQIGLMKDKGDGNWDAFGEFKLFDGGWQFESDPVHHHSDRNPLRAAMVVFLKMKDAENVDHF